MGLKPQHKNRKIHFGTPTLAVLGLYAQACANLSEVYPNFDSISFLVQLEIFWNSTAAVSLGETWIQKPSRPTACYKNIQVLIQIFANDLHLIHCLWMRKKGTGVNMFCGLDPALFKWALKTLWC